MLNLMKYHEIYDDKHFKENEFINLVLTLCGRPSCLNISRIFFKVIQFPVKYASQNYSNANEHQMGKKTR